MTKIALIQGNGRDLVGGGSIQYAYNEWGNSEPSIEIVNFLQDKTKEKFVQEENILGRKLKNIQYFTVNSDPRELFKDIDKIIVLTYPFKKDKKTDEKSYHFYRKLIRFANENNIFYSVLCYDYLEDVVLSNIGADYKNLYYKANKVWVNNWGNPLIKHLDKADKSLFHVECPQFMNTTKKTWKSIKEKDMNVLYYQGRSLDWKGWKELTQLKGELEKQGLSMNGVFNGITSDEVFVVDEFNKLAIDGFPKEILRDNIYYGKYSPETADELTSTAGFAMYFTNLHPNNNFFPEYAFMDAILNGTVVIIPEWYYDNLKYPGVVNLGDKPIIQGDETTVGMLGWNPYDEESTEKLAKKIKELQENEDLYNEYREKAFNYMVKKHGDNEIIRRFLDA